RICDYLRSITRADGGVPSVHVGIRDYPRPPWWAIDEGDTSSLLPTASLAGLLHSVGADDPWLADATEFCWSRIEALTDTHPYEVHNCLAFLDRVPDRARAGRAAKRLGELVRDGDLV